MTSNAHIEEKIKISTCNSCYMKYNSIHNRPMTLQCEHTCCSTCIELQVFEGRSCPICMEEIQHNFEPIFSSQILKMAQNFYNEVDLNMHLKDQLRDWVLKSVTAKLNSNEKLTKMKKVCKENAERYTVVIDELDRKRKEIETRFEEYMVEFGRNYDKIKAKQQKWLKAQKNADTGAYDMINEHINGIMDYEDSISEKATLIDEVILKKLELKLTVPNADNDQIDFKLPLLRFESYNYSSLLSTRSEQCRRTECRRTGGKAAKFYL